MEDSTTTMTTTTEKTNILNDEIIAKNSTDDTKLNELNNDKNITLNSNLNADVGKNSEMDAQSTLTNELKSKDEPIISSVSKPIEDATTIIEKSLDDELKKTSDVSKTTNIDDSERNEEIKIIDKPDDIKKNDEPKTIEDIKKNDEADMLKINEESLEKIQPLSEETIPSVDNKQKITTTTGNAETTIMKLDGIEQSDLNNMIFSMEKNDKNEKIDDLESNADDDDQNSDHGDDIDGGFNTHLDIDDDVDEQEYTLIDENMPKTTIDVSNDMKIIDSKMDETSTFDIIRADQEQLNRMLNGEQNKTTTSTASTSTFQSQISTIPTSVSISSPSSPPIATNSSLEGSRKRKIATISVTLQQFVTIVYDIYEEMIFDNTTKEMRFKQLIENYINNAITPSKQMKLVENTMAHKTSTANVSGNTYVSKMTGPNADDFKKKVYNCIINKVFMWFEAQNASILFPKELLKYFLATYSEFINPSDFIETNLIPKADKRGKTAVQLVNGCILYEYAKGFDTFVSSMARSDTSDIQALKFIVQKEIKISRKLYDLILNINFTQTPHIQDMKYTQRENYSQIMITNNKQMFVLITKDIVMIYDGVQFVSPTSNTEREFSITMRQNSKLKNNDYLLLDIMYAIKIKVIDVLQFRIGNQTELPNAYADRLKMLGSIIPNIRLVTISQQTLNTDCSYINKPNHGFGPSYIYHKSNLTAAAVGIIGKNVVLAFTHDDHLIVKTKMSIVGAVSYLLAIMPTTTTTSTISTTSTSSSVSNNMATTTNNASISGTNNTSAQQSTPTILLGDKLVKIVGDLKDVRIFKRVIPIELKDCNRLGLLSSCPISNNNEYKPNTLRKDTVASDTLLKMVAANPEALEPFLLNVGRSGIVITDNVRNLLLNILQPKIDISFNGYNNLN